LGATDLGFHSPGWKELADEEKRREDAELVRLLYVGLTRARDQLILSTHTAGWKKPDESEQWVPNAEGTRLGPLNVFLQECYSGKRELVHRIDVDELDARTVTAM